MKNTNDAVLKPVNDLLPKLQEGALTDLKIGLEYQLGDFIKLELTAEQMLEEELVLVQDYLTVDTKHFFSDLKNEVLYWEKQAGQALLSISDPDRFEWYLHKKFH
jgi:hypothetical protein